MSSPSALLPFQPSSMSSAQLAAVSYLARYAGRTHALYSFQLRQWFSWCETNGLDPLVGIQRAHIELYIRQLGECGLMDSSVNTMMHAVRGFFRFAHIDGLIAADPAVYARLPKIHRDESRTQGLDRLELIRFLQVAQTISVHHGALAYLLGINALRASEAAAVRIEDYADTLRGYRVLHLVGKANKPATMPLTVPVLRVLEACRGERTSRRRTCPRRSCERLCRTHLRSRRANMRRSSRGQQRTQGAVSNDTNPEAGQDKPRDREALGRSRGGLSTKDPPVGRHPVSAIDQGHHRGTAPRLAGVRAGPGNLAVRRPARGRRRCRPDAVLADKAYSSKAIRGHLRNRRIKAVIPLKSDQIAAHQRRGTGGQLPGFDAQAYRQRNVVERAINKLRGTRAVATRYDKRDFVYRGTIDVAAIRIWLATPSSPT